jgi:hypothetical protein
VFYIISFLFLLFLFFLLMFLKTRGKTVFLDHLSEELTVEDPQVKDERKRVKTGLLGGEAE